MIQVRSCFGMFLLAFFCRISISSAMDQQLSVLRMGLIVFDLEKEKEKILNTHEMLELVLRIPPLDGMELRFNNLISRKSTVNCRFQKTWYDKRHAALAADLIIKGAPLNSNGENLVERSAELKAQQFNTMADVINYGYIWQHLKPLVVSFEKGELSEAEKQKKAFDLVIGFIALEALKLVREEGKDLISLAGYQNAVKPDCMYVVNPDQTITIKNFINGDYVINPFAKR
ncbi:MAG: hypothetical protein M1114_01690 [Candidatus Dependentiae bacterium]|nr:hypothetical protein [Candidatus Dependentiae bacterium]